MPGFDRTGPKGAGPASGRGLGQCAGKTPPAGVDEAAGAGCGRGPGRGQRNSRGRGLGLGRQGRDRGVGPNQGQDSRDKG